MKLKSIVAALTLSSLLFAVEPAVQKYIDEGDALMPSDTNLAERSYVNAKGEAANRRDSEGMLILTNRFLRVRSELHAKQCYLIAFQIAREKALAAKNDGDPGNACLAAIAAMGQVAFAFDDLSVLPMAQLTLDDLQGVRNQAAQHASDYLTKGCP